VSFTDNGTIHTRIQECYGNSFSTGKPGSKKTLLSKGEV
jgi:hypothetical protein